MTESYDMRSNIKGKAGSQGTLFQVKDKGLLNPQQRWPQGYTPERLNEVRGALARTPVSPPTHLYDQPSDETQAMHGTNEYGYRDRVHREIAKTTIPAEHLDRITQVTGTPARDTHGTYWKGGPKDRNVAVDLTARTPDEARKTLVHEIGHHVNMTLAPTPHVHDMVAQLHAHKDAESRGADKVTETDVHMTRARVAPNVDEAQADDYAVEHFRTGGRKSKGTTTGAYEDNFSRSERDSRYPGYNDVRPPSQERTSAEKALQQAQFQPGLFSKERAQGGGLSGLQKRLAAQRDATQQARRGQ